MTIGRIAKRTGITLLVAGLFLLAFHLVIRWRTRQILDFVVKEASGGQYEAKSGKVVVHYYPLRLEASKIIIQPIDSTGKDYYAATADSFFLEIGHIWSLIRRKNFSIRKVAINNLQVQVLMQERRNRNKPFNEALKDIQNAIVNSLTALRVEECKIRNAGIRYALQDQPDYPLYINHINLDIDNLVAERVVNPYETKAVIKANIRLLIDKPLVQLQDTSIHIGVENLWMSTRENKFTVNRFRIQYDNNSGTHDSIILSNLNLQGFNWDRYLEKGELEIGKLMANNGIAAFDFSDRKLSDITMKKDSAQQRKINLPIFIHDVDINKIEYSLRTRLGATPFKMQLDGDSLSIVNFAFNRDALHPIQLDNLAFKVSNYVNNSENNQNSARFDRLIITQNNLELRNYYRDLDGAKFGTDNSIFIPVLRVEDFSLPVLLENHSLLARRLVLKGPQLVLDIHQSGKKKDADATIRKILDTLRSNLTIASIGIENASITLIPAKKNVGKIYINNVNTEIDAVKLLRARSIREMMESATALSSSAFTLVSDNLNLEIQRSSFSKGLNAIRLERLKGQLGKAVNVDLHGVTISDKSDRFDVTNLDLIHLDELSIDSGQVDLLIGKADDGSLAGKPMPTLILDKFSAGNTSLLLNEKDQRLELKRINLKGRGFTFEHDAATWDAVELTSGAMSFDNKKFHIKSGSTHMVQPGFLQFSNTSFITGDSSVLQRLFLPDIVIQVNIPGSVISQKKAKHILVERPEIDLVFHPPSTKKEQPVNIPDLDLELLTIKDPKLNLYFPFAQRPMRFSSDSGIILLRQIVGNHQKSQLSARQLHLDLSVPRFTIDSSLWLPEILQVRSHDVLMAAHPNHITAHIDTAQVLQMPVKMTDKAVSINGAYAGIANWPYSSNDSFDLKKVLAKADWWAGADNILQVGKYTRVDVHNPIVRSQPEVILIDSVHFTPLLKRDAFWDQFPFEKTYVDLLTGPVKIYDYQVLGEGKSKFFKSRLVEVEDASVYVAKDKTRGPDSIKYRPLLTGMFEQIPIHFSIDTVAVINGFVKSDLISAKTKNEGVIYFTDINGPVTNVRNYALKPDDTLQFRLRTRLNGQGEMLIGFREAYLDSMKTFKLEARMGRLKMPSLNSILLPLASFEIQRGEIESMSMNITGNDDEARGTMNMRYKNLKVSWHRKGQNQFFLSRFFNWLINAIINTNSKEKSKLLYAERLKDKAIFNFWGRIAIRGLLTNIGIRLNKKEVRKYRKQIKEGKVVVETDEIL